MQSSMSGLGHPAVESAGIPLACKPFTTQSQNEFTWEALLVATNFETSPSQKVKVLAWSCSLHLILAVPGEQAALAESTITPAATSTVIRAMR